MLLQLISYLLLITSVGVKPFENSTELDSLIQKYEFSETDSVARDQLLKIDVVLNNLDKEPALDRLTYLIEYSEKNKGKYLTGYCYYQRGKRLNSEGEYFKSLVDYTKSIEIFKSVGNKNGIAMVHNALGVLYKNLGIFKLSFENYLASAKLFNELNDKKREGMIYLNLGGMLTDQDSFELAKQYLSKSISLLQSLDDFNRLNAFINIAEVFYHTENYDSALFYFQKSYKISQSQGDEIDKFQTVYHYGKFLFESKGVESAEPYLLKALEIIKNKNTFNSLPIDDREGFSGLISDFYAKKGKFELAYNYLIESNIYQTESKKEKSNQELARLEFDNRQKISNLEMENLENKSKLRLWIMCISIAGLLGSVLLFLAFYRSYKHKQEANRLLTEMDELKNRLYSNITHELRTPLTLILGPLEQMLSSESEKTPTHKQVKMMRKNANSLLTLVNQMLDLTKIDAKNMKLELVEDDINKFLRTRFAAFASLAEQKSINYQFSLLHEKNIRIFDASKLEKIINNLVSNAVKFTGENGKISCYANFHQLNTLELIVEDDGKGIPKDELNKIFDRFHQVKSIDETINIGTGIGLSLTKELVALMHGKITVESEVGKGSKFTVKLPLGKEHLNEDEYHLVQIMNSKAQETPQSKEPAEPDECETANGFNNGKESLPHILIVEDHTDIREFIAENLKDCFFAEQADNGKSGLEIAIKNIPDLVITDIVMPKMDGIELCGKLKTDEKTSHIPVVMLTGKSGIEDRLKGLDTGADAYLTKPFNIKELRLQVSKLIEQRKKLRERFTRELHLEPKDIAVTSADEKFITRAMEIIEKNIGNSEFEVRQFEEEMFMSRMQLFRKIKALTNQTPGDFIRTIRLKRAASLIKQNFGNIAQITYEVGFNNPSYFAKCFKDLYGVLPSDYMKKL
jgi:signal transduction histidine kinase/DNA-binding response OmpR family regulator